MKNNLEQVVDDLQEALLYWQQHKCMCEKSVASMINWHKYTERQQFILDMKMKKAVREATLTAIV